MTTKREREEELDGLFANSTAPRVDGLIKGLMLRFPGIGPASQLRFYEAAHQYLGPLAREIEKENVELRAKAAEDDHVINRLSTQLATLAQTVDPEFSDATTLDTLIEKTRVTMLELELYRAGVHETAKQDGG